MRDYLYKNKTMQTVNLNQEFLLFRIDTGETEGSNVGSGGLSAQKAIKEHLTKSC